MFTETKANNEASDGVTTPSARAKAMSHNHVAVLFVSERAEVLLSPTGDELCLPARMTRGVPDEVELLLCDIFNIDVRKSGRSTGSVHEVAQSGECYHYHWVVVKHPNPNFLRQSAWYHVEALRGLKLSPLAKAAIAKAVTAGVMPDPSTYKPLAEAA